MKKQKRLCKNVYILPKTYNRIKELKYQTGFSQGQIVDLAIQELSNQSILKKAVSVASIESFDLA